MSNLKYWQDKIKEKRKNTDFRDFLKEIVSWYPFILHKNKGLLSKFPETDRISIMDKDKFEETRDKLMDKGISYDFDKSFFVNYKSLFRTVDFYNIFSTLSENSNYGDNIYASKNVYLSNGVIQDCENILYSFYIKLGCSNVLNSFMVWDSCDNVYFSSGVLKSYNIFYSKYLYNSSNVWFSTNLNGCSECIFCENLENESYCINNKKYNKQEYIIKKGEILRDKSKYFENYKRLENKGVGPGEINCNGSFSPFCSDLNNGFFSYRVNKGNNVFLFGSTDGNKNIYDCFGGGSLGSNDIFGSTYVGTGLQNAYFSLNMDGGHSIYYGDTLTDCSYCIGCIGLKNKSYCILNKQYSKEEWEILADKIFAQMEEDGILGDFFPGKLNPFYFNDTMAAILGSFTKEEVEADGYMWRDEEIKVDIPEGSDVIEISDLGDYQGFDLNGAWKINPEVLKKVIKDEKGNYYRIVKMEYDFLVKHGLPLPEIHWMDRMKLNFGV